MSLSFPLHRVAVAVALAGCTYASQAAAAETADLSLEDLLKTEITTVSRKPESLQTTAAAAFVITREDIERSGAQHIPDALRLAPGISVARIANNRWAVTARGFNGRFANKLLVLIDGRSIYSPLFSGVLWEVEDTLLEDVERIEVIRGPGASLWGANAVNGVINIITRKARDTQGELAVAVAGTHDNAFGALRHGGDTADGHYRVWVKGARHGKSVDADGADGNDDSRFARAGFRRDWSLAVGRRLNLSAEVYDGRTGDRWDLADVTSPTGANPQGVTQAVHGGHLMGRHEWAHEDGSESALQAYIEHGLLEVSQALRQKRTTLDVDFQRRTRLGDRHDFVWGVGYRHSHDDIATQGIFSILPASRDFSLVSAFVQDEIALPAVDLRFILGARLEKNSYTGWEPQPNARLVWTPTPTQSIWSALSRAARTPSRAENDAQIDLGVVPAAPPAVPLPVLLRNLATTAGALDAETVNTLEFGYRHQLGPKLSLDLAAFRSEYNGLRSGRFVSQSVVIAPVPYVLQEITPNNGMAARTHGLEFSVDWQPADWWRLQGNYSRIDIEGRAITGDPLNAVDAANLGGTTPSHQVSLRSAMTFSGRRQWDVWLRHTGSLASINAFGVPVPIDDFHELDMRFAWRPTPALELSIVGQNLLKARHAEFRPDFVPAQSLQVERSVYLKAKYQF
jgi:iron complex outermembrane recepter protein